MNGVMNFKRKFKRPQKIVPNNRPAFVVKMLDLSSQMISPEAMAAVSEMLKNDEIAKYNKLKISDNLLKCAGARMLAKALMHNSYLQILDLEWNGIGDRGAKALAKAFAANERITHVNLQWNAIGDEGGKALAEALLSPECNVSVLKLYGNSLSDVAGEAMAENIQKIPAMCKVEVGFNMIQADGLEAIKEFNFKEHPLARHMVEVDPKRKTESYLRAKRNWRKLFLPVLWGVRYKIHQKQKNQPPRVTHHLTAPKQQIKGSMQTIKDDPLEAAAENELIEEAQASAKGIKVTHAPNVFHHYHPDPEAANAMQIMRQLNHIHKDPAQINAAKKHTANAIHKRDTSMPENTIKGKKEWLQ